MLTHTNTQTHARTHLSGDGVSPRWVFEVGVGHLVQQVVDVRGGGQRGVVAVGPGEGGVDVRHGVGVAGRVAHHQHLQQLVHACIHMAR